MIAPEATPRAASSLSPDRRSFLRTLAGAGALGRLLVGSLSMGET